MNNGVPFGQTPVPDLSNLRAPSDHHPGAVLQQMILQSAGVELGGSSIVETASSNIHLEETTVLIVFLGPATLQVHGITGTTESGARTFIPWHAVQEITPPAGPA